MKPWRPATVPFNLLYFFSKIFSSVNELWCSIGLDEMFPLLNQFGSIVMNLTSLRENTTSTIITLQSCLNTRYLPGLISVIVFCCFSPNVNYITNRIAHLVSFGKTPPSIPPSNKHYLKFWSKRLELGFVVLTKTPANANLLKYWLLGSVIPFFGQVAPAWPGQICGGLLDLNCAPGALLLWSFVEIF